LAANLYSVRQLERENFDGKNNDCFSGANNSKTETSTILRRIAEKDKTAVKDCIDAYGNFIWALAKKLTHSREEAARATEEIFTDIWRYRAREPDTRSSEEKLIAMIALRRLIKSSRQAKQISMSNIDATSEQGAGMDRISKFI
jgi:DNA-directed RNA polymerase specialized sigma24 family protein